MSTSDTPTLPGNIVRSGSTGSDISADSTVIASPELLTTNPEKGVSGQLPSDSSYAATARDPQAIPSVPKASAAPVPQVSKKPATRQPARLPPWLTRSGYKPKLQSIPEGEPWPAESIIGPAALDPRPAKKPRVQQPAAATSQLAQTHAQVSAITDESSLDMKSAVGASSTDPSSSKTKVTYMDWTPSYEPQVWCSLAANVDAPSATSPASLSCPAPQRMELSEPNSSAGEQSVSEVASWLCRLMSNWNQAQSADRLKGNKVPQQPAWSCDPQYLDVIPPPLQAGSEVVQALADWCKAQPAQIELINDFVRDFYICAQAAAVGAKRQRVGDSGGRNRPAR
ncbi:MAG: hypothetical protein M1825_005514 [Sarcosagium campestre]|nr:MAG: hypothetical protein M1825_005514 [Sarcosagium campestre]